MSRGSASHDTGAMLLGTWQLLRAESPLELEPGTRMEFGPDGALTYLIPTADGPLCVALRWHLDRDLLHTSLADGGNPVQARVAIGGAEVLTVDFGGKRAWFVRTD